MPLYNRLYSQAGPDFKGENVEVRKAISFVSMAVVQGFGQDPMMLLTGELQFYSYD